MENFKQITNELWNIARELRKIRIILESAEREKCDGHEQSDRWLGDDSCTGD